MTQSIREKAKIRQNREEDRATEDDIARARLGPRGQEGKPDTATMTEESKLQSPPPVDPGHTA
jgi:hypothetical protein